MVSGAVKLRIQRPTLALLLAVLVVGAVAWAAASYAIEIFSLLVQTTGGLGR